MSTDTLNFARFTVNLGWNPTLPTSVAVYIGRDPQDPNFCTPLLTTEGFERFLDSFTKKALPSDTLPVEVRALTTKNPTQGALVRIIKKRDDYFGVGGLFNIIQDNTYFHYNATIYPSSAGRHAFSLKNFEIGLPDQHFASLYPHPEITPRVAALSVLHALQREYHDEGGCVFTPFSEAQLRDGVLAMIPGYGNFRFLYVNDGIIIQGELFQDPKAPQPLPNTLIAILQAAGFPMKLSVESFMESLTPTRL